MEDPLFWSHETTLPSQRTSARDGFFNVSLRGGGGEILLLMQDAEPGSVEPVVGTGKPEWGDPGLRLTEQLSERWGLAMTPAGAVDWASFASEDAPIETAP